MSQTPSAYSSLISQRSRRLRTIGIVLLIALFVMFFYGLYVLIPSVRHSIALHPHPNEHIRRALYVQALFAYAYFGVWALLVVAAIFVAWLDVREVLRSYSEQRRLLLMETANRSNAERMRGEDAADARRTTPDFSQNSRTPPGDDASNAGP